MMGAIIYDIREVFVRALVGPLASRSALEGVISVLSTFEKFWNPARRKAGQTPSCPTHHYPNGSDSKSCDCQVTCPDRMCSKLSNCCSFDSFVCGLIALQNASFVLNFQLLQNGNPKVSGKASRFSTVSG